MWEEIRLAQPPHWNPWNSKVISSIAVVLRAQNGLMNKLGLKSSMNRSLHTFIVNVLPLNWGGGVIRDVVARYQLPHQSGILREKGQPWKTKCKAGGVSKPADFLADFLLLPSKGGWTTALTALAGVLLARLLEAHLGSNWKGWRGVCELHGGSATAFVCCAQLAAHQGGKLLSHDCWGPSNRVQLDTPGQWSVIRLSGVLFHSVSHATACGEPWESPHFVLAASRCCQRFWRWHGLQKIFAWMWTVASMCWQLEELACRELERSVSCPWWFKRSKAWMSPPQPRSISKWPSQTLPTQWGLLQLPLDASQYLGEFAAKCAGSHFTGLNLQYLSQLPCLCPHVMLHSFGQILRCYHMLSPFSGLMWFGLRENAGHAGLCTFFWPPTNLQLSRPRSSAISAGPGLARVGVLPGWLPLDPQKLINCADIEYMHTHILYIYA